MGKCKTKCIKNEKNDLLFWQNCGIIIWNEMYTMVYAQNMVVRFYKPPKMVVYRFKIGRRFLCYGGDTYAL